MRIVYTCEKTDRFLLPLKWMRDDEEMVDEVQMVQYTFGSPRMVGKKYPGRRDVEGVTLLAPCTTIFALPGAFRVGEDYEIVLVTGQYAPVCETPLF